MKKVFDRIGYKLDAVRSHRQVPRVFLANVPKDLANLREPAERKNVFIMMTLPLVLNVNEIIQQDRAHLKRISVKKFAGKSLTVIDKNFLEIMECNNSANLSFASAEVINDHNIAYNISNFYKNFIHI